MTDTTGSHSFSRRIGGHTQLISGNLYLSEECTSVITLVESVLSFSSAFFPCLHDTGVSS